MLNKIIALAALAALAAVLTPSKVDAWGAARVTSTAVGPGGGVYYTERTVVGGPGGAYAGSRTTAVGATGGGDYRYNYGYAGGVGVGGGGPGYIGARDGLAGNYVSQAGAPCSVRREGDSYVFTNEQGSWARFVSAGPNRLEQSDGQWDRSVTCAVTRDDQGRLALRFDSPNAPSGYWTPAD
jgi:hypothetical protein